MVLDRDSGDVLASLPLPGVPDVVMHDPELRRLYVAVGEPGLVCSFDTDRLAEIETAETEPGAHTIAWDPGPPLPLRPAPQSRRLPGGPESYNHYNTGWAWAFDTPFPYWKRWAGYEGGISDMCLVSWPARIAADTAVREQYVHAVDVVPTIYDLVGITPPTTLKGYDQRRSRARASPPR